MKRFRIAADLLLIVTLIAASLPVADAAVPAEIGAEIEDFIAGHEDAMAGVAAVVFDRDGELYSARAGHADMEGGLPVTDETVFEWGSATKTLVWVSVMQLWEQGRLELTADVRTYLPEGFLTNLRYDGPVTMLHLMNHDAGFQETLTDIFLPEGETLPTLEESLRRHQPVQIYAPGEVTAYSNWGVALAGYIVERVSGQSFADYVHQNIFQPLGMERTALAPDLSDNAWVRERRESLRCYTADGKALGKRFYHIVLYPAGMCTGTPEDFARFGMALLGPETVLFERPETLAELFAPTKYFGGTEIPENCHGFWMVPCGVPVYGHGGNTAGCSSYLLLAPEEGLGMVVMTNQSNEEIFNGKLPEAVFGSWKENPLLRLERTVPEGIWQNARIIKRGPLRLTGLGFLGYEEKDLEDFWVYDSTGAAERVCHPYVDALPLPAGRLVLELGLALLWAAGCAFAGIWLLVRLARMILRRVKGGADSRCFQLWSAGACWALLASAGLLAGALGMVSSYAPSGRYAWLFGLLGALGLGMLVLTGWYLWKRRGRRTGRAERVLNGAACVFLTAAAVNIAYWQLYMFWGL